MLAREVAARSAVLLRNEILGDHPVLPLREQETIALLGSLGDTVNLASRIEGLTRIYGLDLLVSERFAGNLPPEYGLLHVDTVRVKGRRTPERLFHPYEKAHLDPAWAAAFTAARERYVVGDFDAAGAAFAALAHEKGPHGLAHLYRQRCETLVAQPREKWEGIWDFAEK